MKGEGRRERRIDTREGGGENEKEKVKEREKSKQEEETG